MHTNGHVGAALFFYASVAFVVVAAGFTELALLGGVGVAGLSMVPDLDLRVPGIPHRGPTHTVWFALAVAAVLGVAGALVGASRGVVDAVELAIFGFVVGFITVGSHIAADALTPMGVRPFAPYRTNHYTYDVAKAANPVANYGLLAIGGVAALVAVGLGNAVANAVR